MKMIWMRLGAHVELTDEEIKNLLSDADNKAIIQEAIAEGRWYLSGSTYIPQESIEDFNREYGTDYDEEDYDYDI